MRALVLLALVTAAGAVFMFRPAESSDGRSDAPVLRPPANVRITQELVTAPQVRGFAAREPSMLSATRHPAGLEGRQGRLPRARAQQRSRSFFARLGKAIGIHVEHTSDEARRRQR